ncbi:MAG: penicillin-binding protein [Actinomycetota bacterium]|nr:penicillin-binding protein [Actinomycetota bacterium]
MYRRGGAALLACLCLLSACDGGDERPSRASSSEAAAAFATAVESGSVDGLVAASHAGPKQVRKFVGWIDDAMSEGEVTSISFDLSGPVEEPSPAASPSDVKAVLPYTITYFSDAAEGPVIFEGELTTHYDEATDAWSFPVSRRVLWPGMSRVSGFSIGFEWQERGRILDRKGKVFARGSDADRSYPFGVLAGSTIGHLEPLTKEAIGEGAEGEVGDLVGGSGIEAGFQDRLAGTPDRLLQVVDRNGRPIRTVGRVHGSPGRDVKTTLDVDIQRAAAAGFGSTVGGSVVLRPRTGDILAVVTSAELDPNNYVGVDISPFNRALSGLYPPGSSMKVVTSSAALGTGVVTADTQLTAPPEYKGVRNFEDEHFESLDFATALKFSVNTAFAQVAEKIGANRMTKYANAFGFNTEPKMQLHAATSSYPRPEDEGDLLWSSVGQAQVLATPLEMASVAATVANGGKRMEPRIVLSQKPVGRRVISQRVAATLTRLMEGVVEGGTGVAAQIPGVAVAGKTGTAEVDVGGERKNHAWFVCFAPAGGPKLAVSVVSEYGGIGGEVAAPLARQILSSSLPLAP